MSCLAKTQGKWLSSKNKFKTESTSFELRTGLDHVANVCKKKKWKWADHLIRTKDDM